MKKIGTITLAVILLICGIIVLSTGAAVAALVTESYVSDTSNQVAASSDGTTYGPFGNAVATWVHPSWPSISGATWIADTYYEEDPVNDTWLKFQKSFTIPSNAIDISGSIEITSDNAYELSFNGVLIGSDGEVYGPCHDDHEWSSIENWTVSPQTGTNTIEVIVRNYAGNSNPTSNPIGVLYKMTVDYETPVSHTVSGTITYHDGGQSGASVSVTTNAGTWTTTSGTSGAYSVDVDIYESLPGGITVDASYNGCSNTTGPVAPTGSATTVDVDIAPAKAHTVSGTITYHGSDLRVSG